MSLITVNYFKIICWLFIFLYRLWNRIFADSHLRLFCLRRLKKIEGTEEADNIWTSWATEFFMVFKGTTMFSASLFRNIRRFQGFRTIRQVMSCFLPLNWHFRRGVSGTPAWLIRPCTAWFLAVPTRASYAGAKYAIKDQNFKNLLLFSHTHEVKN